MSVVDPRIDRSLPRILEDLGGEPVPDYSETILARTAPVRQRPAWIFPERWLPMAVYTGRVGGAPRLAWMFIGIAIAVLAVAAGVAMVGSQPKPLPAVVGPAGNGLFAYSTAGDIYVGDPVSGATTAIVTGPELDSSPIFSPDGTRIAFVRGDPWSDDANVIVVRPDGSDRRVVMPAGFSKRGIDIAWTPDGAEVVTNLDTEPATTPYFDGELALLDAAGVAAPRVLSPPLPIGPGGPYLGNAQVAAMFRPPDGDLILSAATGTADAARAGRLERLDVWDADLETRRRLVVEGLEQFRPYYFQPWALRWSPDGSKIAFELGWGDQEPFEIESFVMNADGTGLRRLPAIGAWSPDGSMIAFERCSTDPDRRGAVIVVADVASGVDRVLEATSVQTKEEGSFSGLSPEAIESFARVSCGWYDGPTGRSWDYEGWSWSPDGRSIVMLERNGTRPIVVDVETGKATELAWQADSAPSWQRVAGN